MSLSDEQASKMARAAIFGNYITYTGCLHRKLGEVEAAIVSALHDAYRAGLEEALERGAKLEKALRDGSTETQTDGHDRISQRDISFAQTLRMVAAAPEGWEDWLECKADDIDAVLGVHIGNEVSDD